MLPAEHKGHVETRLWYKVKWTRNPYPERQEWRDIEGKTDLMMDEDLERFRNFVEVVETVSVEKCTTGLSLAFGRLDEKRIDEWIARNRK